MELFGIGWMEMVVIGLVALIVVGPERLPQAARAVGKVVGYVTRQVRNIQEEIRTPVENEVHSLKSNFEDTIHDVTDIEPLPDKSEQKTPKAH